MAAAPTPRLADVVSGPITVTVPWTIIAGDDEGLPASGTATYTIGIGAQAQFTTLCDDLDRAVESGNATVA